MEGVGGIGDSGGPWPAESLFRLRERCGPDEEWDVAPFPAKGGNVLGVLRTRAASSFLARGFGGEGAIAEHPAIALSAEVPVGGRPHILPLKDEASLQRAIQLWGRCTGVPGGMLVLLLHEERTAASDVAATATPRRESCPALPVEMWVNILDAVGNSRCVFSPFPPLSLSPPPLKIPLKKKG